MPKRALIALAVFGLTATACVTTSTPAVDFGQGSRFVPFVVDSTDDVGQASAIAITADGLPYISYFGFPAELAEGEIAVPRPFGSPAVPGVMLATASKDSLWQRGAVNTIEPELKATGVSVPFGPVLTPKLDLTAANSNGTSVVVADDGTVHVAWAMGSGVYHATTKLGGTSTVEEVWKTAETIDQAGPIGRPGLTLDADGNPWIAFTVESSGGRETHAVHSNGTTWADDVVAKGGTCNGCPPPQATGIGVVGDAPMVVYTDPVSGSIHAATLTGRTWEDATIASTGADLLGVGLSFTTDGAGAYVAYYGGDATVTLSTFVDGGWSSTKVADAADPDPNAAGNLAPTTAVAIDGGGTVYVAWQDAGLHMASGTDTFTTVDLGHTVGDGVGPALAAAKSGVALAWYESKQQNTMVGFLGDLQDVLVANPSPSLTISIAPPADASCGKDGKPVLDVVAKGLAFEPTCLVAQAGAPFDLTFDNEDAGIQHNVAIYTDATAADNLFRGEIVTGVVTTTYKVDALDAGSYYFQCDIHTTMKGQFVVVGK